MTILEVCYSYDELIETLKTFDKFDLSQGLRLLLEGKELSRFLTKYKYQGKWAIVRDRNSFIYAIPYEEYCKLYLKSKRRKVWGI